MSKTQGDRSMRVPDVGEHNGDIYGGLLDISAEEMEKLKAESII
jgi:crotonobetainyl-CoA:carnitine CoA-transferase CaiB-like acyl-CoA transferase